MNVNGSVLEQKMSQLKLGRMRQVYADWLERAAQSELSYAEFLDELLSEELLHRQENQLRRRMRAAAFPFVATVEQFDWNLRPELKRAVMLRYFDSAFVEKASNLLLIGASGLGKTLLAVAIGTKMVQLGYEVRFVTAQALANQLLKTTNRSEIEAIIQPLVKCNLLIVDELGYLPLDSRLGPVLYELVSGRYQKGATIITSNKSLGNWGEIIGGNDSALMMAIIDRLLHHGEAYYFKGPSLRLRGKEVPLMPNSNALKPPAANGEAEPQKGSASAEPARAG